MEINGNKSKYWDVLGMNYAVSIQEIAKVSTQLLRIYKLQTHAVAPIVSGYLSSHGIPHTSATQESPQLLVQMPLSMIVLSFANGC